MKVSDNMNGNEIELAELSLDLKRMLRMQIKELIHSIEDVEFDQRVKLVGLTNTNFERELTSHRSNVA